MFVGCHVCCIKVVNGCFDDKCSYYLEKSERNLTNYDLHHSNLHRICSQLLNLDQAQPSSFIRLEMAAI